LPESSPLGSFLKFYFIEIALFLVALPISFAKILQKTTASIWWHAFNQYFRNKQWKSLRNCPNLNWEISLPPVLSRDRSYLVISNQEGPLVPTIISGALGEKITPVVTPLRHNKIPNLILEWRAWLDEAPVYLHLPAERQTNDPQAMQDQLKQAAEKYKNLLEQTRSLLLLPEKDSYRRDRQLFRNSKFLFTPKPGELIHAIVMQNQTWHSILDVTFHQEKPVRFAWQWWFGRKQKMLLSVREITLPDALQSSSANDVRRWLSHFWNEKADWLETLVTTEPIQQDLENF
jgi:hypothetical protein